jgi:DNA-binding response OmpR family regulator
MAHEFKPAKRKKILIIDNERGFTSLIKSFLEESCNYEVKVVPDGYNGMRKAAEFKPDLIFLDILMPAVNGFYILEKLKEDKETASIPVIMVTAVEDDKYKEKAKALHCEGYLVKPIKLDELRNKISEIFGKEKP